MKKRDKVTVHTLSYLTNFLQVPAVYWWYKTASHAAELTAGYYNPTNQDGYSPLIEVLKKHSVTMKFLCSNLQENRESMADPEGLSWQVICFLVCLVFPLDVFGGNT